MLIPKLRWGVHPRQHLSCCNSIENIDDCALHMLYRYQGDNKQRLDISNRCIELYSAEKAKIANRRYSLFPESSQSYLSSAISSARQFFGI